MLKDGNCNTQLGDFGLGLGCQVDDYSLRSTPPAGTMGYLDPGQVTPDHLSTKTDVFIWDFVFEAGYDAFKF